MKFALAEGFQADATGMHTAKHGACRTPGARGCSEAASSQHVLMAFSELQALTETEQSKHRLKAPPVCEVRPAPLEIWVQSSCDGQLLAGD